MKIKLAFLLVFVLLFSVCYASDSIITASDLAKVCQTPPKIADWIRTHIWYKTDMDKWEKVDYWQSSEVTLSKNNKYKERTGDCEDFAVLTFETLHFIDVEGHIIGVMYKKGHETINHVVCTFQYNNKWCYIDQGYFKSSNAKSSEEMLKAVIGTVFAMVELDTNGKVINSKVVR